MLTETANAIAKTTKNAPAIYRLLNGVLNIYKPSGMTVMRLRQMIITTFCRDLNDLDVRPMKNIIEIENTFEHHYQVRQVPDYSDHVLAAGPRYQATDFTTRTAANLGRFASGVLLLGLNDGKRDAFRISKNRPIRVYHVTGFLGKATESHFPGSRVIERATIDQVKQQQLNNLLSSIEASHQKKMFDICGVDIQSQAAYEFAVKGTIRPSNNKQPMLYSIKCVEFTRPFFVLEIYAINETDDYFGALIHDIGIELRTVAHCTSIRCIRHGLFTLENSVLQKDWNLQRFLYNLSDCNTKIKEYPDITKETSESSLINQEEDLGDPLLEDHDNTIK